MSTSSLQHDAQGFAWLGLGTAQFGLDYGITNSTGKVSSARAYDILAFAAEHGMRTLDTAALYGDSEDMIAAARADLGDASFDVVTKTIKLSGGASRAALLSRARRSAKLLGPEPLYGLMLHDAGDLLEEQGELVWGDLLALKEQGVATRIGYSLYSPEQLTRLLARGYRPDIIQIPVNAFDQRFVTGSPREALHDLKRAHQTEVHARSCFLQGVLLASDEALPAHYGPLKVHVERWHAWLRDRQLTPLQGALGYHRAHDLIDRTIIGVQDVAQLRQIISEARSLPLTSSLDWTRCALDEPAWRDPSQWPPRS